MTTFDSLLPYDSDVTYDGAVTYAPPPAVPGVSPIPHFLVPFVITDAGSVATVQQGTLAEIIQSVSNLIGTTPGTRYMVPGYGIPDPTFEGIDPVTLRQAVAKWEPRAAVSMTALPDGTTTVTVGAVTPT